MVRVATIRNLTWVALGWLIIAGYCLYQQDLDALWLWVLLPVPFGLLLCWAWRSGYVVVTLFMALIFLSHAVLPPSFFIDRKMYGDPGFTAIGSFDFSLTAFLGMYSYVLFYVVVVASVTLLVSRLVFRRKTLGLLPTPATGHSPQRRPSLPLGLTRGTPASRLKATALLAACVAPAALLNAWMYAHNIAITGIESTALPFRLAGILYYASRFVLPVALFFIYMRTSRSWLSATILLLYAFWAGTSQLSRTTITTLALPVLAFVVIDRRWMLGAAAFLFYSTTFQWVGLARNFVYYVSGGVAHGDLSLSLPALIQTTVETYGIRSAFEGLFGLIGRIGGGQDVVLALQYNTAAMGGSWNAFCNYFLARPATDEMTTALFGTTFPHGFAAALGFSANMLLIAGKSWGVLFGVSVWVALLLMVGEALTRAYVKATGMLLMGYVAGGLYVIFLCALGTMGWFYSYVFVAVGLLFALQVGRSFLKRPSITRPKLTGM
jgi:hypothetical protein